MFGWSTAITIRRPSVDALVGAVAVGAAARRRPVRPCRRAAPTPRVVDLARVAVDAHVEIGRRQVGDRLALVVHDRDVERGHLDRRLKPRRLRRADCADEATEADRRQNDATANAQNQQRRCPADPASSAVCPSCLTFTAAQAVSLSRADVVLAVHVHLDAAPGVVARVRRTRSRADTGSTARRADPRTRCAVRRCCR